MNNSILFAFLILLSLSTSAQTNPNEPNILLIISDDLGVDYSNGYQSNMLMPVTPMLDSLRNAGLTFANAWSAPVCSPTRASIMSGKYGIKTGVQTVPGNLSLADTSLFTKMDQLTGNSYSQAVIGKWHLHDGLPNFNHPQDHGVDYFSGVFQGAVSNYFDWPKLTNGVNSQETTYATTYFSNEGIAWINSRTTPWFLWLAEIAPHSPYHVPPASLYTSPDTANNRQKFVTAIEALDTEIARLIYAIPQAVRNNTNIIYIGDNGTPGNVNQNYPQGHAKSSVYQGGIHVPFFVSGPAVTRVGQVENALVHVADIHATILEITGTDHEGGTYNSHSFLPLLSDANGAKRPYNYSDLNNGTYEAWAIRNEQYKLIQYVDSTQEFYDLIADPLENTDLIAALTNAESLIKDELEQEALTQRDSWSCNDGVKNGDEDGIDCGGSFCAPCGMSVNEFALAVSLSVFPNPTSGIISFNAPMHSSVSIRDMEGRLLFQKRINRGGLTELDLEPFDQQVLMIQLSSDGALQLARVVKL